MENAINMLATQYCGNGSLGRIDVLPNRDLLLIYEMGGRSNEKIARQYECYEEAHRTRNLFNAVPSYAHRCPIDMELRASPDFEKASYYLVGFLRNGGLTLTRDAAVTNEQRYIIRTDAKGNEADIRMRFVRHPQMANEIALSVLLDDKIPDFTDIHRRVRMWRARLHNNYEGMDMNGTTGWNVRLLGGS